jgi:hypothetical protein
MAVFVIGLSPSEPQTPTKAKTCGAMFLSEREPMMRHVMALAALLTASGANPALANFCEDGQQPVPPAIAERMALPLCGFAATHRWGPNGCQLCDSRNMYPNPFATRTVPRYRYYYYDVR